MIGTVAGTPIAILIRPFCHCGGINSLVCQAGYHNRHRGRATSITADIIGSIRKIGPTLIQLIVVDDFGHPIRKDDALIALTTTIYIVFLINAELLVVTILLLKILHHVYLITNQPLGQYGKGAGNEVQDEGN